VVVNCECWWPIVECGVGVVLGVVLSVVLV
jgi:hypothetical protein